MNHKEIKSLFDSEDGWTTQFEIDGIKYGGEAQLVNDPRLLWHIDQVGGIQDKTILELGPLEGGHTLTMIRAGASKILAIEGNDDCFHRCLIVQEVLSLYKAKFILGDFCEMVESKDKKFDIVSASGVLYHQLNPAKLIHDLAEITDTVFVWSHVAGNLAPNGEDTIIGDNSYKYLGKFNHYGNAKTSLNSYCAGLNDKAVWMYPEEMIRCFNDAGFENVVIGDQGSNQNGNYILFIARK